MEESLFILTQLLVLATIIGGVLTWVVRGMVCRAMQEDCSNKVVLITGCDTGIGHEIARHLDGLGFTVFAGCLDTASEGAQRLRVEAGPRLRLVSLDVTNEKHVEQVVDLVSSHLPAGQEGLYALVNNAGICVCGEFDWQTKGQIEQQVSVNLLGPLRVTKACLPLLKNGRGRVINVSSVAGIFGYPGLSIYCATKHALEGFSQVLRLELAKFGVSVVTVQPGDFSKATHLLDSHHRNMNLMWGEMSEESRRQYSTFFTAYHDNVSRSGVTGKRQKPVESFPSFFMQGFEKALLTKVPDPTYLVLPTWTNQLKMAALSLVPSSWYHSLLYRRYKNSVPNITPATGQSSDVIGQDRL